MGCELNIMRFQILMEYYYKNYTKKANILFIDFKSAFDSVDHKILFQKMHNYGIDVELINTIK